MTAETRFERDLPAILEDLYLGPTPDYRDEVMAGAVRSRQRPSWTFAGRWIPMADIATKPVIAPRVPWRAIGAALLVIALVLAAAAIIVGSRQTRVPPPFGLARNGQIAYASKGDIFTEDPVTGQVAKLTSNPAVEDAPVFSPDGTRIAFTRDDPTGGSPGSGLVVVSADGRNEVVVTATPIHGGPRMLQWAPDSRSLLVDAPDDSAIWLFDATKTGAPRVVAKDANSYLRPFQPPDGHAILIARQTAFGSQIVLLDVDTGHETVLAKGGSDNDLGAARWSPDGKQVVYNDSPLEDGASERLFIVNSDGSGRRQVTNAPGVWFDIDPTWSPDGTRVAFTRYLRDASNNWDVIPTGILDVRSGKVIDAGPRPRDIRARFPSPDDAQASVGEGFWLEWSPDGTSLLARPSEASGHVIVIDPDDGSWRMLDPVVAPGLATETWQRQAP